MTKEAKLEKALEALHTAIGRYEALEWFDGDEGQQEEANEMTAALEAGDEISVGVALDRALTRYDLMGAFTCDSCGQDFPQLGCTHHPCECGDETFDYMAEQALEIKTALEALRTPEIDPEVEALLGTLESEIERREDFKGDEDYQESAARMQGFVDDVRGVNPTEYTGPERGAYLAGVRAARRLRGVK